MRHPRVHGAGDVEVGPIRQGERSSLEANLLLSHCAVLQDLRGFPCVLAFDPSALSCHILSHIVLGFCRRDSSNLVEMRPRPALPCPHAAPHACLFGRFDIQSIPVIILNEIPQVSAPPPNIPAPFMSLPCSCCVPAGDPNPDGRSVGGYVERRRNHLLAASGVSPFPQQMPGQDGPEHQKGRVLARR